MSTTPASEIQSSLSTPFQRAASGLTLRLSPPEDGRFLETAHRVFYAPRSGPGPTVSVADMPTVAPAHLYDSRPQHR